MFGLVTGLVKGVVDVVDDTASEIDSAIFGPSERIIMEEAVKLKALGFSDEEILRHMRVKYDF